jgi:hypothetical protein
LNCKLCCCAARGGSLFPRPFLPHFRGGIR